MHRLRVLSALLLLVPFSLLVAFGSPLHFHLVLSLAILLCAWEFAWLCPGGGDRVTAVCSVLGALAWQWAMILDLPPTAIGPLVVLVMLIRAYVVKGELSTRVMQAAWTLLGLIYAGGLLGCGSLLRNLPDGRQLIFFVALTTWVGDTGAYYVGSRFGKRPLAPRISPKKTLEGVLGGVAATVLLAAVGCLGIWPRLPVVTAIWVGLLVGVAGILGDLAESAVKRAAAVKDSGTLIPGHGGVLDRLDSVVFACPVLYGLVWMGLV